MTGYPNNNRSGKVSSDLLGSREDVLLRVQEDRTYKPMRSSHASLMGGDPARRTVRPQE